MPAITLGLSVDTDDKLARGYPASVAFSAGAGISLQDWQPASAQVEMRTLRSASSINGPQPHGRARGLVEENFSLFMPSTSTVAEQAMKIINDVNEGRARAYLTAERTQDSSITWRSPIYAGDFELDGASLDYENRMRYRVSCVREPWWENSAAASSIGSVTLASRTSATFTAPTSGTIAAPITWALSATSSTGGALRIHLWQDRHAPHGQGLNWTAAYTMSASSSTKPSDDYRQINFSSPAPSGKNLGYPLVYQSVLMPSSATNAGIVRSNRGTDGFTLRYGRSSSDLAHESEVGVLGKIAGLDSIFTNVGLAVVDETTDYFRLISYANKVSGTSWRLGMAPTDGHIIQEYSAAFSGSAPAIGGAGAFQFGDKALWISPGERFVIYPLIETLGASGAEYSSATNLTLAGTLRPRISEL